MRQKSSFTELLAWLYTLSLVSIIKCNKNIEKGPLRASRAKGYFSKLYFLSKIQRLEIYNDKTQRRKHQILTFERICHFLFGLNISKLS